MLYAEGVVWGGAYGLHSLIIVEDGTASLERWHGLSCKSRVHCRVRNGLRARTATAASGWTMPVLTRVGYLLYRWAVGIGVMPKWKPIRWLSRMAICERVLGVLVKVIMIASATETPSSTIRPSIYSLTRLSASIR